MSAQVVAVSETKMWDVILDIYLRHQHKCLAIAFNIVDNQQLAEDILRDVFEKLIQNPQLLQYDTARENWPFVAIMIKYACLKRLRDDKNPLLADGSEDQETVEAAPSYDADFSLLMDDMENFPRALEAISQLPNICKDALLLHYIYDLPAAKIDACLGITIEEVWGSIAGALEKLQNDLALPDEDKADLALADEDRAELQDVLALADEDRGELQDDLALPDEDNAELQGDLALPDEDKAELDAPQTDAAPGLWVEGPEALLLFKTAAHFHLKDIELLLTGFPDDEYDIRPTPALEYSILHAVKENRRQIAVGTKKILRRKTAKTAAVATLAILCLASSPAVLYALSANFREIVRQYFYVAPDTAGYDAERSDADPPDGNDPPPASSAPAPPPPGYRAELPVPGSSVDVSYRDPFSSAWPSLESLPDDYRLEEAVRDSVYVNIQDEDIYNQNQVDIFYQDALAGIAAFMRTMEYTPEGDPIITDYQFDGARYTVTSDTTRDKFGSQKITSATYEYLVPHVNYHGPSQFTPYFLSNEPDIYTAAEDGGITLLDNLVRIPSPSPAVE